MEPPAHDHDSAAGGPFELSAGALCLDFVNIWSDRARPESDRLGAYRDLLAFAAQAGIASPGELAEHRRRAGRSAPAAAAVLDRARALREALYGLFSPRAAGRAPAPAHLQQVNEALRAALPDLRVAARDGRYGWTWDAAGDPLAAPLRPIVRSAAELLVSPDLDRVRECLGVSCTWLFLDASRNRSRRWCSMESCGNRAKARRHYRRRKEGEGEEADER